MGARSKKLFANCRRPIDAAEPARVNGDVLPVRAMKRSIGAALAMSLLCGRVPVNAQPEPARVTLSGDVELSRLVELVAREASVSIEYAPTDLVKRITRRVREALTARQLWDVLAATLEGQGLVIVRTERS